MGIYDREYYRREGPSFLNAIGLHGQAIKWLIGINILLFIGQLLTRNVTALPNLLPGVNFRLGPVTDLLVLQTDLVMQGQVWRLLTYAFLHDPDGVYHILFNLLFLWWFGSDVEAIYGTKEFLAIYLVSALAGGVVFEAVSLLFPTVNPRTGEPIIPRCLGASGAVTAVMVLCACHFPTRIILVFFVLPVPIWLFVIFQVAQDAFVFASGNRTGVAVVVHLAGAGFAFGYYKAHWRILSFLPDLRAWKRARSRPRLRVYRGDDEPSQHVMAPTRSAAASDMDEQLEAKLDAVLEKVARFGQASLTESEKQILQRASDMYRRRRT
jgi:membrane associated rhomboid family serine protease